MSAFLIVLASLSVQAASANDPRLATNAIRCADALARDMPLNSIYWDPKMKEAEAERSPDVALAYAKAEQQYRRLISSIDRKGCFTNPIRLSLVIRSASKDDQGRVVLDGTFQAYTKMVEEYRTKDEADALTAYEYETEEIVRLWNERVREEGEQPIKQQRLFDRRVTNRDNERDQWVAELATIAQPRKDYIEIVDINVTIPSDMMPKIKVDELMKSQRVLLMMQVEEFTLQPPFAELAYPPAIGSLKGTATWMVSYMLKEN